MQLIETIDGTSIRAAATCRMQGDTPFLLLPKVGTNPQLETRDIQAQIDLSSHDDSPGMILTLAVVAPLD